MRINIFGVGRSGTKAVQLYLSYLLALKENNIRINYEPYFWETRFTDVFNFEGYYYHMNTPHLVQSTKEFSKGHLSFLKKISSTDLSVTTKFIRGNGRMDAINAVIQPDHNVAIIRDLYQVLVSVLKTEWDFWSVGFEHIQNWDSFIKEVRNKNLIENYDWCLDRISDRLDQNAFYWYVMNKSLLQSNWPNTYFINYSNIKKVEDIAREIFDPSISLEINNEIFKGDSIHENYPLISKTTNNSIATMINNFLYHTKLMNKYGLFISSKNYGSDARVNNEYKKIHSSVTNESKISIAKKDLFEFVNEDILKLMKKVEWNKKIIPQKCIHDQQG
jgi:hypothetical protein